MVTIRKNENIRIIMIPWTCDASGDASASVGNVFGYKIIQIQTVPGLNGDLATALPTDLYNVAINDEFGEDIAVGELANRSETVAESIYGSKTVCLISDLIIVVSNAGDTKSGLVNLYLEKV